MKSNDEHFKYHVQGVLSEISKEFAAYEKNDFNEFLQKFEDSIGRKPLESDLRAYFRSKGIGVNRPGIITDDTDTSRISIEDIVDKSKLTKADKNAADIKDRERAQLIEKIHVQHLFEEYHRLTDIEYRISKNKLEERLHREFEENGVSTPFEYAVTENNRLTNIKSPGFSFDPDCSYQVSFLRSNGDESKIIVSFPHKKSYLFSSSLLGITSLSLIFTLIIIIAYLSAVNQLIKQKNISEIKSDFINNMTHEFKTPIATINLALDAIKNPKIFEDKERVNHYLKMIKEENKRMHSQVENVLQISKLDKKELDIEKEQADIEETIESAIEHVSLILEERQGVLTRHFNANRKTVLLNETHFTNVLVNILENAIKYSPDEPVIDVYTENVKDVVIIKISDRGIGMNKATTKQIFEKFYREHTGDLHDVKGHGLGLAYVKRIVDDHNSQIYVESEKGKGSTFIIKMPLIN